MSNERYGRSFVQELIDDDRGEEALEAAVAAVAEKPAHAAAHFDHALALELLERGRESVAAYEQALACNVAERSVESFVLDDAYISALIEVAQAAPAKADKLALVARYRAHAAGGAHLAEVAEWEARFAGLAPSLLDKTRD